MRRLPLIGFILVELALRGAFPAGASSGEQALFKDVKRVKIVVSQSYGEAKNVSLPFYDVASKLLKLAGITVVEADSQDYDAVLEIEAKGEPIRCYFSKEGEFLFTPFPLEEIKERREKLLPRYERDIEEEEQEEYWRFQFEYDSPAFTYEGILAPLLYPFSQKEFPNYEAEILYPAAYLKGTITMRNRDGRELKEEFEGLASPPDDMRFPIYSFFSFFPSEPDRAPFYDAFSDVGSFLNKIGLLVGKAFGIESLIPALKEKDVKVYTSASRGLMEIGAPTIPYLASILDNSQDIQLRSSVVSILAQIKDPASVQPLIKALEDESLPNRWESAEALGKLGDKRAVEPLIKALDYDEFTREKAVEALGKLGDPRAVKKLTAIAQNEKEKPDIRGKAIYALGKIGGEEAVNVLLDLARRAMKNPMSYDLIFTQILIALGNTKDPRAIPILADAWRKDIHADYAGFALSKIGAPAVDTILPLFKDKGYPVNRRAILARALGKIGDKRAIKPLVASLEEGDPNLLHSVTWALYKIGEASAPELISLLKSENLSVKESAVVTLGKIKAKSAIEPLSRILRDKNTPSPLKQKVAQALDDIGTPEAEAVLLKVAKDKEEEDAIRLTAISVLDWDKLPISDDLIAIAKDKSDSYEVRKSAIRKLLWIGDKRIRELLFSLLDDPKEKEYLKSFCINLLGKIGGEGTADKLISLAQSTPSLVKDVALALADLGDSRAIPYLISFVDEYQPETHPEIYKALKSFKSPQNFQEFQKLCQSDDPKLRRLGAELLGNVPTSESFNTLLALLKDEFPAVRSASALSLGKLGRFQATEPLINCLKDDYAIVRESAAKALGDIGDKRAVEALLPLLDDPNPNVQKSTVIALGKLGDARALPKILKMASEVSLEYRWEDIQLIGEIHKALVHIGAPAVEPLISILKDEKAPHRMRELAVLALADIGDMRAVEPILSIFEKGQVRGSRTEPIGSYLLLTALRRITFQDFGWEAKLWREWWESQKNILLKGG